MCFPFFCLLLFFVVHRLCVFLIFFVFFSVVFPLFFFGYVAFCVFLFEAKGGQIKKKGQQQKEEIKKDKKKEEKGNPPKQRRNFGEGFLFCFCSAVYLKHPPPKGAKTPKRQGFRWFFLILSKIKHHTKTNQNKRTIRGATLWSTILGGISLLVCFPFLFFVVYFFIFFVFSLFLFFLYFVLFFLSCFFFGYVAFCVFLFEAKGGQIKKKGQQQKEEIEKEKKKEEKGNPPKQRRNFGEGFLFCFCSAVYLKHPPPKGAKTPKRQGFRWFFLILSKIKHHTKTNQNKRTNQGGNLVIYHFGGYFFVGVFPVFVFCGLFFHLLCVFIVSLLFIFCVVFPLLFLFWLCCFLCLSLWSKRRTNKEKRATTKGRNREGKEKGRERKPPKQRRFCGKGFLFCFCSAVYL